MEELPWKSSQAIHQNYRSTLILDSITGSRNNAGIGVPEVGRWLSVSHRVGHLMSYCILPESVIPVTCTTLQRMTNLEKQTYEYKARMKEFDVKLEQKWAVQYSELKKRYKKYHNLSYFALRKKINNSKRNSE